LLYIYIYILFYTAIVLFEQSKCVDSIFTSDKRSLTVYNISGPRLLDQNQLGPLGGN